MSWMEFEAEIPVFEWHKTECSNNFLYVYNVLEEFLDEIYCLLESMTLLTNFAVSEHL